MTSLTEASTKPIRRLAYLLLLIVGGVGLVTHAWWFEATRDVVVLQRAGSWLTVWGIAVTARPILTDGVASTVQRQMPRVHAFCPRSDLADRLKRAEARRPEVRRSVIAERVAGVVMIVCGTLLNGYGDMFGRWLLAL